jgi:AcrR family transcriptional regulator
MPAPGCRGFGREARGRTTRSQGPFEISKKLTLTQLVHADRAGHRDADRRVGLPVSMAPSSARMRQTWTMATETEQSKRKGVRTQERILLTAGRHFARRGYSAVTLKDIADDVGVTPAMIVRYFGSKRALFKAAAHVEAASPPIGEMSAEERARALIRAWQDPDLRTPAIALIRSLERDGGELFEAELRRRGQRQELHVHLSWLDVRPSGQPGGRTWLGEALRQRARYDEVPASQGRPARQL